MLFWHIYYCMYSIFIFIYLVLIWKDVLCFWLMHVRWIKQNRTNMFWGVSLSSTFFIVTGLQNPMADLKRFYILENSSGLYLAQYNMCFTVLFYVLLKESKSCKCHVGKNMIATRKVDDCTLYKLAKNSHIMKLLLILHPVIVVWASLEFVGCIPKLIVTLQFQLRHLQIKVW